MLLKLLTAVAVILAAAFMLFAGRPALPQRGATRTPPRVPRADDLVRCARCGVWSPAGQRCDCSERA
jgi:hypothetical protein